MDIEKASKRQVISMGFDAEAFERITNRQVEGLHEMDGREYSNFVGVARMNGNLSLSAVVTVPRTDDVRLLHGTAAWLRKVAEKLEQS